MESYIKYSSEGEIIINNRGGDTLDQVLTKASEMYAFNDCTDIEVLEVVHNGEKYDYCVVNGVWVVWSPVPSSPTTRP